MAKGVFKSIAPVLRHIINNLNALSPGKHKCTKISLLYACNASGKTRLSKLFAEKHGDAVLYYNAFTEDFFSWDNDDYAMNFNANAWIFKTIGEQGLESKIVDNFQEFTGSKIEPKFDLNNGQITFGIHTGSVNGLENVKISRGEESVFVWSIFYTILDTAIEALNDEADNRTTTDFDKTQYIVIDDPVSSMDDTRIITIALGLAELIAKSKNPLKFLITTHHALFFNVLFNIRNKNWDKKNYILSKSGTDFLLKPQGKDSPFAYHHVAMAEIDKAIKDNDIKKYHFNIFRALLEKTANFMGHDHWKKCLEGGEAKETFIKTIDHYSHNKSSDLEYRDSTNDEKEEFKAAFRFFKEKYKWGK